MENITVNKITDGNIEECRDLCNELMHFQQAQATLSPQSFAGMNFDTRMKPSFDKAERSQVVVVKDGNKPIGYVFSTIESINNGDKSTFPEWAPIQGVVNCQGFYSDGVDLPEKCGCLNNLYLKPEYQSAGLGSQLLSVAMEWFASFSDVNLVFVYISNGNDRALAFYEKYGFVFSHDVFGGFIKAAYYKFNKDV